jgi:nucleoside-diphosphate kinase
MKPDGVQRGLVGEIIKGFEQKGFCLVAMKFLWVSKEHLKHHYIDLKDYPFFPGLEKYMNSGPVVAMGWEGLYVVKTGQEMLGEKNPVDSKPGTFVGISAFMLAAIQWRVLRKRWVYGLSPKS